MSLPLPTPMSSREVLERVPMRTAIAAVERAYAALRAGHIADPVSVGTAVDAGSFHVKACAGTRAYAPLFVAKVNSNFPGNHAYAGLPTIQGVVAVFETGSGRLRALVDSGPVTQLRTAATMAVAVGHLARTGARSATLVGCGALGRFNLEALAACGMTRVRVVDRVEARAWELAAWARSALALDCEAASALRPATLEADVIVTCTTSRTPLLASGDVRPGTFVAALGADNPTKAEIAASLLAEARIVTDDTAQCRKGGDLRNAVSGEARVCGELAEAIAGDIARGGADEIVLFDSTGQAVGDLAVCALLVE